VIELPPKRFGDVGHLFPVDYPNSTMLFSVLEGHLPGAVYAERLADPSWAIVMRNPDFTFAGGVIDQSTLNDAISELSARERLVLVWAPQRLPNLHPPPGSQSVIERLEFFDREPPPRGAGSESELPEGTELRQIDAALLERCLWHDMMLRAFGTVRQFVEHGLGFCLMRGDEILSEAYGVFLGAGRFEIGAITAESHRGKGYAVVTCRHLAETIEAQGYATYWSCHRTNVASAATARRLGYRVERPYQLYVYQ
jgi:RimJ/RimL family protein N-acetyltransferase